MSFLSMFGAPTPVTDYVRNRRETWAAHTRGVEVLRAAGIPAPPEWVALRERYAKFIELPDHGVDRLAKGIVTGTGDLTELRAVAMAEAMARQSHDAGINERVQQAVLEELVRIYASAAPRNYKLAAGRFDTAAKAFTNAASHLDLDANGDQLVTVSSAARQAWLDAPSLATELEESLHTLCAAAALAGAPTDVAFVNGATDIPTAAHQIALACDPGKCHRRKVWLAWLNTDKRTGRWGALAALGVKIRAANTPTIAPYKEPEPFVPVVNSGGRIENWDPHDGDLPGSWRPVNVGWQHEHPNVKGVI